MKPLGRVRTMMAMATVLVGMCIPFIATSTPAHAYSSSVTQITNFGSNPGSSQMWIYVPAGIQSNAALIVDSNPAGTSVTDYDTALGFMDLADRWKNFAIVFDIHTNNNNTCSYDTDTADGRGGTETTSTLQMVQYMEAHYSINTAQVFSAGLSCGAVWAYYMGATYPDVFSAVAGVAGLPWRCANGNTTCNSNVNSQTPQQWGDAVRNDFPGYNGPWPRVSIWQGGQDNLLNPNWRQQLLNEWSNLTGASETPATTNTVGTFTHTVYDDSSGKAQVEMYYDANMGHTFPVNPGPGKTQCGNVATFNGIAVTVSDGTCAAYYMARWFGINPDPTTETTAVISSNSNQDGYVLANSDGSSASVGCCTSIYGVQLGRNTAYPFQYARGILSFDTSSIGSGKTIDSAYVLLTYNSNFGDPWTDPSGNSLVADVKNGCFVSGCALSASDWSATPTASAVTSFADFSSGTEYSGAFNSAGLSSINSTGTTQVKLRFSQFQNNEEYVFVGHASNAQLVISYH